MISVSPAQRIGLRAVDLAARHVRDGYERLGFEDTDGIAEGERVMSLRLQI